MTFKIGQKVVCVRDDWPAWCVGMVEAPRKGALFTVRTINDTHLGICLRFHELQNPILSFDDGISEPQFCVVTTDGWVVFRPLVERKTDISIFTKMLTPNNRELVR